MPGLKPRAKTIVELAQKARFYVAKRPIPLAADTLKALSGEARQRLGLLGAALAPLGEKELDGAEYWKPSCAGLPTAAA